MNFINRDIAANISSGAAPRGFVPLKAERKWPIRYESIEVLAIFTDLATILLASVLSAFVCRIHSGWTATDLGKAVGCAMVVSALFVSLLKIHGMYRPTELLVM